MHKIRILLWFLVFSLVIGCGGHSDSPIQQPPQPTITGHWSGILTSAISGASGSLSGDFVQGTPQSDGIPFTGTVAIPQGCIKAVSITGKISGSSFALIGSVNDGGTLSVMATLNAADTQMNGTYNNTGGTVCPADHGTFSLSKQ